MEGQEDLRACVHLQEETWGCGFSDIVPGSILQVTAKMGGIVLGAFDPGGTMLGFVYGVTGIRNGELAHWSHMLAVRRDARDLGIGRRLKLRQRRDLLAEGIATVYWTFDPLVARNAHLNLNRLGVKVSEYVPDMYCASDSDLHQLGTDRFVVSWDLNGDQSRGLSPPRKERIPSDAASRPAVGLPGTDGWPPAGDVAEVEVLIPSDIEAVKARSHEEAVGWRISTRTVFTRLLGGSYSVTGFVAGSVHSRYIVSRIGGKAALP